MKFPSVTEYEDAVSLQRESFKNLDIEFELSNPKAGIWTFGSGQFAVVFKGRIDGENYAIRCFQHSTEQGLKNYSTLSEYLKKKDFPWLSKFVYHDNEIIVGGKTYPVLVMEWVEGLDIHNFISANLNSNYWLLELQKSLITLSENLEKNGIGHGDLQKGNVIVVGENKSLSLKLIDYDGMFVSPMLGQPSLELGKPDIQHPKRNKNIFNEKVDRFSIWLIITAIEAIKYEKNLWKKISEGGYNDDSNFLFTYEDLNKPEESVLFSKLLSSSESSVKEYTLKLKEFCEGDTEKVTKPKILNSVVTEKFDKDFSAVIKTSSELVSEEIINNENEINKEEQKEKEKEFVPGNSDKNTDFKPKSNKKGGKKYDTQDSDDKSNSDKLKLAVKQKNMYLGLFVASIILTLFLLVRYGEGMSDYSNTKRQYEEAYESVQSLKSDLNEMTDSRNAWQRDYYDMKDNRDNWMSDYYDMQGNRDYWQGRADYWYDDRERVVRKWNNHVNSRYCYSRQMCNCW